MSHIGRIPAHLRSAAETVKALERRKGVKHGAVVVTESGAILTAKMKEYCEELVYGGTYRTINQWADFCGVTVDQIRRWNKSVAVQEYLTELRTARREQMQENYAATLGTALNELLEVIRLPFKQTTKKGKVKISASLVDQKRTAIMEYLNMMRTGGNVGGVNVNVFNSNQQQQGQQSSVDILPTKEEIDKELSELEMIERALDRNNG